jgi:hypothetical protein
MPFSSFVIVKYYHVVRLIRLAMRSLLICLVFGATGLLAQGGDIGELVEKRDNVTLMVPVVAAPSAHWFAT